VIITPRDVPDAVLSTLLVEAPAEGWPDGSREEWRAALALALTAWEGRIQREHRHVWTAVQVENGRVIVPITWVLQRCDGCGEVQTAQLNGTWTIEQVREGKQS
jgi:hypothetical protein